MEGKHLATPALAFAFALALLVHPGLAQTTPSAPEPAATVPAKPDATAQDIMKFSQSGNNAIREIGAARVAIFDGDPKLAMDMITKAKASVANAEMEAPTFAVKTTTSVAGKELGTTSETEKAQLVPVDGQLVLADDFVPTSEKNAHIGKANEYLKNGKNKEAMEELRLGEIEVMYARVWMPLASTSKHIEQAIKLMDENKYYEANLALKTIGDSLTVDSVSVLEVPKTRALAAQAKHFAVIDTVGNCSVLDSQPGKNSGLTIIGDKGGYPSDADAKEAFGSKCKG